MEVVGEKGGEMIERVGGKGGGGGIREVSRLFFPYVFCVLFHSFS